MVDSHGVAAESRNRVNFVHFLGRRRSSPTQIAAMRGGIGASFFSLKWENMLWFKQHNLHVYI